MGIEADDTAPGQPAHDEPGRVAMLRSPLPPYAHRRLRSDPTTAEDTARLRADGDQSTPTESHPELSPVLDADGPLDRPQRLQPDLDRVTSPTPRRRRLSRLLLPLCAVVGAGAIFGGAIFVRREAPELPSISASVPPTPTTPATSSIPPLASLAQLPATVRLLAGGPDDLGNGGDAGRALFRHPTAVARLSAGLVVADAGALRLVRSDGGIEAAIIDGLPAGYRIDALAVLPGERLLAADATTARFLVINGVGTGKVRAVETPTPGVVAPVDLSADGSGGVLIADAGSGSIWRWTADQPPALVTGELLAPTSVSPLPEGGAIVADRGTGLVVRVTSRGGLTPIAADALVASSAPGTITVVRASPLAARPRGADAVEVLLADGSITRVPLVPRGGRGSLVTEYLSGATSLTPDGDALLVIESGERRIVRVTSDATGRGSLSTLMGGNAWPRFSPDVLTTRDVVLIDPTGFALSANGSVVVADRGANVVWRLNTDGSADRLAGTRAWGNSGDNANANESAVASPTDVAVSADGTVFFTEPGLARIRSIRPDGSLGTALAAKIDRPDQALFSPGPLVDSGAGNLIVGDRFVGGLWRVAKDGVAPIRGANPGTRFVAISEENGNTVGMDPFGSAVSITQGEVRSANRMLVKPGSTVRGIAGAKDRILVATIPDPGVTGESFDGRPVAGWSGTDNDRNDVVAIAASDLSVYVLTTGRQASLAKVTNGQMEALTSTAIGAESGRANETPLGGPVSLDAPRDGSVLITDRGGARVRSLRAGVITTVAGNGRRDLPLDPLANATQRTLGALRDAQENRNGSITVVDDGRIVEVDGSGLLRDIDLQDSTGQGIGARAVAEDIDGALLVVADDGRLLRVEKFVVSVLAVAPTLARVRITSNGTVLGVTNSGRLVELRGHKLVEVDTPRDLAIVSVDERGGRLVALGRNGEIVVRRAGGWFRLSPTTSLVADRRANRPATPNPTDVAILADGAIIVADAGRDAVLVYRATGSSAAESGAA